MEVSRRSTEKSRQGRIYPPAAPPGRRYVQRPPWSCRSLQLPDPIPSEVKTKVNSLLYVKSRFYCTTKVKMCIACILGNHLQKANSWFLKLLPTCPKAKLILAARAAD